MPAKNRNFSGNAMNFYLRLDDQMTPVINAADRNYNRLTRSFDRFSVRAGTSGKNLIGVFGRIAQAASNTFSTITEALNKSVERKLVIKSINKSTISVPSIDTQLVTRLIPMAEGGFVNKPTKILAGEAGPEAIIPLSKGFEQFKKFIQPTAEGSTGKAAETITKVGAQLDTEKLKDVARQVESFIKSKHVVFNIEGKLTDKKGKLINEQRFAKELQRKIVKAVSKHKIPLNLDATGAKQFTDITAKLNKALGKEGSAAKEITDLWNKYRSVLKSMGITQAAFARQTDQYSDAVGELNDELGKTVGTKGVGLIKWLTNAKNAFLESTTAITGKFIPAITAASFGMAASIQDDWLRIRQSMGLSEKDFKQYKKIGYEAMTTLGISTGEMVDLMKEAASMKMNPADTKEFVRIAGMAVQGLNLTTEAAADLVSEIWHVGLPVKEAENVLSGLSYMVQQNWVDFGVLKNVLTDNIGIFQQLKLNGKDSAKSMTEFAAVVSGFSNVWGDAQKTADIMHDLFDPANIEQNSKIFNMLLHNTGTSMQEVQSLIKGGKFGELGTKLMEGLQNVDLKQLNQIGSQIEQLYGIPKEFILNIKTNADPKAMADMIQQAEKARIEGTLLKKRFDEFNSSLKGVWDRIKNTMIPILYEFGEPLVKLVTVALTPVLWAARAFAKVLGIIPGPFKIVLALVGGAITLVGGLVGALSVLGITLAGNNAKQIVGNALLQIQNRLKLQALTTNWNTIKQLVLENATKVRNIALSIQDTAVKRSSAVINYVLATSERILSKVREKGLINIVKDIALSIKSTVVKGALGIATLFTAGTLTTYSGAAWGAVAATWAFLAPVVAVVGAIALLVGAGYGLYKMMTSANKSVQWLGVAIGAILFPIGAIVAAIVGFKYALAGFKAGFVETWNKVKTSVLSAFKPISDAFHEVMSALSPLTTMIGGKGVNLGPWDVVTKMFKLLGSTVAYTVWILSKMLYPVILTISGTFKILAYSIKGVMAAGQGIIGVFKTVYGWINWLWDALVGHSLVPAVDLLATVFGKVWSVLSSGIVPVFKVVAGIFRSMEGLVEKIIGGMVSVFQVDPANLLAGAAGLGAMALGIAALGGALLAATPGILAFSAAYRLLPMGEAVGMGGVLGGIASLFNTGNIDINKVVADMQGMKAFLEAFSSVAVTLATLSAGALAGGIVSGITKFFTGKSPLQMFIDQAPQLFDAMQKLQGMQQVVAPTTQPIVENVSTAATPIVPPVVVNPVIPREGTTTSASTDNTALVGLLTQIRDVLIQVKRDGKGLPPTAEQGMLAAISDWRV